MMHASSESDTTSTGLSSASPRDYYVQSPSRDSHDDTDKCSSSNGRSPMDSPSYPRHSTTSSTSTGFSRIFGYRRRWNKYYCDMVAEEDGEYDDDDDEYYGNKTLLREWGSVIVVVAFGLFFGGICLAVWGVSKDYKPHVTTKSIRIESMSFGEGVDRTGVPSKFISLNASANLLIYNPASLFGMQIASHSANLIFSQVTIASGQLQRYYHPSKSRRMVRVKLVGREVPLYGAALELELGGGGLLPLKLDFKIKSSGCLTKHTVHFSCFLHLNTQHTNSIIVFHDNSCRYF